MSFPAGELFGHFKLEDNNHQSEYLVRCKSAYCTLLVFGREFFNDYVQIICGDKLKFYQISLNKYLQMHCNEADKTRRLNMKFLTQTNFNQRRSSNDDILPSSKMKPNLPSFPSVEFPPKYSPDKRSFQTKSLSSRKIKN
jgi:hypothetical protein